MTPPGCGCRGAWRGQRPSRGSGTLTTASLADDATETGTVTLAKSYQLLSVTVNRAAWVRLYQTAAARTADASRAITEDPDPAAGVVCDVYLASAGTLLLAPTPFGFNAESTPTNAIPYAVTNKSGSSAAVQVDFVTLKLEA